MAHIEQDELLGLLEQGLRGNASGVNLLCRRFVSKAKKTNPELAQQILALLSNDRGIRGIDQPSSPVDKDSRQNLIQELFPVILEVEPVWPENLEKRLLNVLKERRNTEKLISAGLDPIKSTLFSGPPGVGKTLAAKWLAKELGLPLLTLDLASVMSSYLGKTGANIRSVIDYARQFPCVLLLDEFDAIAKRRDDDRDVGELKRLVTVLLQSIDDWPSSSLLIAATNHPNILDPAVWRRFEVIINFDNPTNDSIAFYFENEGVASDLAKRLASLLSGSSFANLRQIVKNSRKLNILDNTPMPLALISQVLQEAYDVHDNDKRELEVITCHLNGLSQRKIAELLGTSHTTVARILRRFTKGNLYDGEESTSRKR